MGEAAYGSVRKLSESGADSRTISPQVRGQRMHQEAQRYAEKRAALIELAEEEASAKARDGWSTACGSSRARSKKLAAKRPAGHDLTQHRPKQKVETSKREVRYRETRDTKSGNKLVPNQRSKRREKSQSRAALPVDAGSTLAPSDEVDTAIGAEQPNDSDQASSNAETETVSPLPGSVGCLPQQSVGRENVSRRMLKRRPSEILADDTLARLEHSLADLKDDVARAPGELLKSATQGSHVSLVSPARSKSPTNEHGHATPSSRHPKRDTQKPSRSASIETANQMPGIDPKRNRRVSQQRLDALLPDLAKVVDLLPQDQRQVQREELLTLAEKAPANFDSPPASPRHSASDTDEDPLLSQIEAFVSSAPASAAGNPPTATGTEHN